MKRLLARFLLAASSMLFSVASYGQTSTGSSAITGPSVVLRVDAEQDVTILSATTTSGKIKNGGILNGTTSDQFTGAPIATGDPNTIAFTDTLTITTDHGTLINDDVTIFNPKLRVFSTVSNISSGTGIFKGATGTLFISGSSMDVFTTRIGSLARSSSFREIDRGRESRQTHPRQLEKLGC